MKAKVGDKVHPRYKGIDNWEIKAIAELYEVEKRES